MAVPSESDATIQKFRIGHLEDWEFSYWSDCQYWSTAADVTVFLNYTEHKAIKTVFKKGNHL